MAEAMYLRIFEAAVEETLRKAAELQKQGKARRGEISQISQAMDHMDSQIADVCVRSALQVQAALDKVDTGSNAGKEAE